MIQGTKISQMDELVDVTGNEYIPVIDSSGTNKKIKTGNFANKSEIPSIENLATKEELSELESSLGVKVEQVSESSKELQPNIYYIFGEVAELTITLATEESNILSEYMFQFTSGSTATILSLPETIKWIGDNTIESNKTYQVSIINNLAVLGGSEL